MRSAIVNAKRIVVKVGSSTLCYTNGHLNLERIERLVRQLSDLANQGKEIILVSSGATGAGLAPLGFKEKPRDLVLKQAAAAVGQGILIHMYERMFREYGRTVGQILLTKRIVLDDIVILTCVIHYILYCNLTLFLLLMKMTWLLSKNLKSVITIHYLLLLQVL